MDGDVDEVVLEDVDFFLLTRREDLNLFHPS